VADMTPDLIVVEETLDDIVTKLNNMIDGDLRTAYDASVSADQQVNVIGIYEGDAKPELEDFYRQYMQNIAKLSYYYYLARRYVERVKDEMVAINDELTLMIEQL